MVRARIVLSSILIYSKTWTMVRCQNESLTLIDVSYFLNVLEKCQRKCVYIIIVVSIVRNFFSFLWIQLKFVLSLKIRCWLLIGKLMTSQVPYFHRLTTDKKKMTNKSITWLLKSESKVTKGLSFFLKFWQNPYWQIWTKRYCLQCIH